MFSNSSVHFLLADQRRTTATTDAATAEDDEELDEMALEESEALAAQRRLAALVDEGDLALAAPTETNEACACSLHVLVSYSG